MFKSQIEKISGFICKTERDSDSQISTYLFNENDNNLDALIERNACMKHILLSLTSLRNYNQTTNCIV